MSGLRGLLVSIMVSAASLATTASAQQAQRQRLKIGPVLEAEAVGAALASTEEGDQVRHLLAVLQPLRHVPAAACRRPVSVALLVAGDRGDDRRRVARATASSLSLDRAPGYGGADRLTQRGRSGWTWPIELVQSRVPG